VGEHGPIEELDVALRRGGAPVSTWLVTGANRGIGLEMCRQLAAAGHMVIATSREPERATDLARLGVRLERLDVSDGDSVRALARSIGALPIDALVNNAGRGGGGPGIGQLKWDMVAEYFWINTLGPMRVTQALLPSLRRGAGKKIAHLSSNMGSIGDNTSGGHYAYRSSKAALNMMNRSLAHELEREGFTCLVLHPGWVQTSMGGPKAPMAVADSVAALIALIDGAVPAQSGKFLKYDGTELAW
jgi:NAD(P)-dependent dehydrogenase (short-subunit alcohol dehydrogenase family)